VALTIIQVDAFTDKPFSGNPAAVCVLDEPRDDEWMQAVAHEMNLSETAFLQKRDNGYGLRWFTPTTEVELCGHGTLASAHVLWEEGYLDLNETARFHTLSGELRANRDGEWIELDFPSDPVEPFEAPESLEEALAADFICAGRGKFDVLVEVDSEETLRNIEPDFSELEKIPARGIIVTTRAESSEYDFVSRLFAPRVGVNEDPVTGSAHCTLGPYWREKLGKSEFTAYQASARGGVVRLRVEGARVFIAGKAVTVMKGELTA